MCAQIDEFVVTICAHRRGDLASRDSARSPDMFDLEASTFLALLTYVWVVFGV